MGLNLILTGVWLCIAVPLLLVNLTPVRFMDLPANERTLLIGTMAMVLAVYNFVRWYASRAIAARRRKANPPPKKRAIEGRSLEYNPELDFNRAGPRTLPVDEEKPNR